MTGGASANDTQHEASAMMKATRFNLVDTISGFPVPDCPFPARIRSVQRVESDGGGSADDGGDPVPYARRRRRHETIDTPSLQVGEVLVEVYVATIRRDELEWPLDRLPTVPSSELSGVVVAVADDVDVVAVGEEL